MNDVNLINNKNNSNSKTKEKKNIHTNENEINICTPALHNTIRRC